MMHSEDPAILLAPAINNHKVVQSPQNAPILRLPAELLARCFEPILGKCSRGVEDSAEDKNYSHAIAGSALGIFDKRRLDVLHVCHVFRTIGVDTHYSQNNFIFFDNAHLDQFLARVDPEHIGRIQHIILEQGIEVRFDSQGQELSLTLEREYGFSSYAALSRFVNLQSVHLRIELLSDLADDVTARTLALLPRALTMETWPEDVPWPTRGVSHTYLSPEEGMVYEVLSSRENATRDGG